MANQQPTHRAYTIVKREGQDDFWLAIGAAFPHQSGDGFNVILQALPMPGADGQCKIVLRPLKSDDDRSEGNAQSPRSENKPASRRR